MEDYDGTILGNFCIAKGKYLWKTEEDFSLFLLSIYKCGKLLLDEIDSSLCRSEPPITRQRLQAELTYLLAQQFINGTSLLKELAKEETSDKDGSKIFYLPSMLESPGLTASLPDGEILYPSAVKHHKLYIKDQSGRELGYLSFADDRLYYVVVPLFEQKKMQIKIQTAERRSGKSAKASAGYQNLHLWIKIPKAQVNVMPENLNLQIEQLLSEYQKHF